jgi:hypothetical protein
MGRFAFKGRSICTVAAMSQTNERVVQALLDALNREDFEAGGSTAITIEETQVFRMRDDKVVEVSVFRTRSEALTVVGKL